MGQPRPLLSFIFGLFKKNVITVFTTIYVQKNPSCIWCRDLNPQPSKNECPPITTRPGLPPNSKFKWERSGHGLGVRMRAFYSEDSRSSLAEVYRFFMFVENNEIKQKEAADDPLKI